MKGWYKTWYGEDWKSDGSYKPMMRLIDMRNNEVATTRCWLQDMIHRHQGAVDMANKVLAFKDLHDETKSFAKNIINNQNAEIEQMNAWLSQMQ